MYVRKNCHLFMQRLGLHWPYRGRGLPVETKICSVNRGRLSHHLCGIKDFFSCSSDKTMTQAKSPICFNTGEPPNTSRYSPAFPSLVLSKLLCENKTTLSDYADHRTEPSPRSQEYVSNVRPLVSPGWHYWSFYLSCKM